MKNATNHSLKFLEILRSKKPEVKIRTITHSKPIFVYWVSPDGLVLDAKEEHHENPPYGDRMILTDKTHKGHLRGRSAFIGNHIYVVIYGDESGELSQKQITLLRKSHLNLLNEIRFRISKEKINLMDSAHFINESGEIIEL